MAKYILTKSKELNFRTYQGRIILNKQSFKTYEKAYEAMKKAIEEQMEDEKLLIKSTKSAFPNEKHDEYKYEINEFNAKVEMIQGKTFYIYEIEEID